MPTHQSGSKRYEYPPTPVKIYQCQVTENVYLKIHIRTLQTVNQIGDGKTSNHILDS